VTGPVSSDAEKLNFWKYFKIIYFTRRKLRHHGKYAKSTFRIRKDSQQSIP